MCRGDSTNQLALPEGFSLWQESANLRVGAGYKDNVTLSSFAPQGSAFEMTSGEVMVFRMPWDNWQFVLFATGADVRYFDSDTGVDAEQNAAVSAQLTRFLGRDWRNLTTAQYTYVNQVMDISATYGVPVRQQVLGHGITGKEAVRKDLGRYWLQAELAVSRYYFQSPLDDYWQGGLELSAGRTYGHGSELSLSYRVDPMWYDTREQTDDNGFAVPGTHLRFLPQTLGLVWHHYWDEKRQWRSTTRMGGELLLDNGSGYFEDRQLRLGEQLRFRPPGWELSVQAGLAYHFFPDQPLSLTDPTKRERLNFQAGVRAEKTLARHWKVYAAYDYEQSFSNLNLEQYETHVGSGGVEFFF